MLHLALRLKLSQQQQQTSLIQPSFEEKDITSTMATSESTSTSTPPRNVFTLDPLKTPPHASQKSTIIFLHGLGDDGRGTGYGLAQKFQTYQKLPYTKWVLPTAPVDPAVGQRCWYKPHDLDGRTKNNNNDDDDNNNKVDENEDEEGILDTVKYIDSLVAKEVSEGGVDPSKIVVGGFSQGCAVSMVWGLQGEWRAKVAGVCGLSGYFPNIRPSASGGSSGAVTAAAPVPHWFFAHGMSDRLIPIQLFAEGQKRLQQLVVDREKVEGHVYEELAHDIGGGEIRDLWLWLKAVLQEDE